MTKTSKLKNLFPYILAPLITAAVLGINFFINKLFPFGDGTVAWCDMQQQVVPLLCDFKDILTGKAGIFQNLQNAGGMNMWGVIFFFLASPFSLLTVFVDKADMMYFVNILLVLKLMTCSLTSAVYFRKCQRELGAGLSCALSVAYAFCGYAMLFYQNIIWLDIMYLFPLLLIAFSSLTEKGNIIPYVIVLTAFMIVNYYISYMQVIFILLFFAAHCIMFHSDKGYEKVPVLFLEGSGIAALLSAFVWLPCFLQYLSSGRGESIIQTVGHSVFITDYQTTFPLLMCTASALTITVMCAVDGKPRSKKLNMLLILFALTLLPLAVEPINLMWHTGNYMSFPARYGFITVFLMLACAGYFLSDGSRLKPLKSFPVCIVAAAVCTGAVVLMICFSYAFTQANLNELAHYTTALWGNEISFRYLLEMFLFAAAVYAVLYFSYRKGLLTKHIFTILLTAAIITEGYCNADIYISYPDKYNPDRSASYRTAMDMSDKLEDSGFYRVTTDSKLFDVNLVGAMGYNSISHYTSLTDRDYMYTMKRLGYSSYWMEVGSYGGTEITDAALSVKYKIGESGSHRNAVYTNDDYEIYPTDSFVPLGIISDGDLSDCEDISDMTASEIQQFIYSRLLGGEGEAVIEYRPYSTIGAAISETDEGVKVVPELGELSALTYSIDVNGRQSLYFCASGEPSNNLTEDYYGSFSAVVNGVTVSSDYPNQKQNGFLKLGEFENERVLVTIRVKKTAKLSSFGVFGVDKDKLLQTVSQIESAKLVSQDGKITGTVTAEEGQNCIICLPFSDSLMVEINGEKVTASKVFGDFIVVPLSEGENTITVKNLPKGFYAGVVISIIGIAVFALYIVFRKKLKYGETLCAACTVIVTGLGAIVILVIYIAPCILNILI